MIQALNTAVAFFIGLSFGFCLTLWLGRNEKLPGVYSSDRVDGLEADLESAVLVAHKYGAKDWAKRNYPKLFKKLEARK